MTERSPNAVDQRIGENMRARREAQNMSQQTLARSLGVPLERVQRYEQGASRISARQLMLASAALNVSLAELIGDDKTKRRQPSAADASDPVRTMLGTIEGARLARLFSRIDSPYLRKRVVQIVELIIDEKGKSALVEPSNPPFAKKPKLSKRNLRVVGDT